jgi:predicted enzyme related to lactoylglutathione lyase
MEPCKIEWITIPAPDIDSAMSFYGNVFGFTISKFTDRFWIFKAGNISGGLDQDLKVNMQGIGFSVTVSDIDESLRAVVNNGGEILKNPYSLGPGAGYCAQIRDPNGNVLEMYSSQREA